MERKMVQSVLFLFPVWSTSPLLPWRHGPHFEQASALMWAPPQPAVWVQYSGALSPGLGVHPAVCASLFPPPLFIWC